MNNNFHPFAPRRFSSQSQVQTGQMNFKIVSQKRVVAFLELVTPRVVTTLVLLLHHQKGFEKKEKYLQP